MKPKVLPGLVTGCARLALVLRMVFSLPPVCGSWRRVVGGSSKGWQGLMSHLVALFWVTATQRRQPHPSPGGCWRGTWPLVLVCQGHPALTAHSRGSYSSGVLLHPHPALILLSCAVGADEEMADVLQDVGLRSVSMGLMVLRRCWENLSVLNPCLSQGSCSCP